MRAFLILLLTLGLFASAPAADSSTGKVVKVLSFWVDHQNQIATSPSLFDRDAYQAHLRDHTNEISAVRYDVLWSAPKSDGAKLTLRVELRGVGEKGIPRLKSLEAEVVPGQFRKWTTLTLGGEEFKNFGSVVAWRATLWNGNEQIGEKQSFLW